MRKLMGFMTVLTLLALGGAWAWADQPGEEKIPLNKLPKAVSKAVQTRFPDAKLVGAEKEKEKGKTVFEVAIEDKGQKIEVTLTPEGKIVEIEKQIKAADLPAAVKDALQGKYKNPKYQMIEEVIKIKGGQERLAYYEVLLTTDNRRLEVSVAADGKILRAENKSRKGSD